MQDIGRQIGIAARWLPLVVIFAIAGGLVAFAYSSSRPVVVEATGLVRVDPGRLASSQDRNDAVLAAVGYASEMEAPGFARAVINELGLDDSADDLLRRVSVDVDSGADVGLIQIGVRSTDPLKARAVARAFGEELISRKNNELYTADVRNATQQVTALERDRDLLRRQLRNLQSRPNKTAQDRADISNLIGDIADLNLAIENLRPFTRAYVRNLPSWVVQPRLPSESVAAGPLYWTLLATVVAAMAAIGLAFVIEYLRNLNKIRDERDLELASGLPAIGTALERRRDAKQRSPERLVMLHYPRSDAAEAYRALIARIGFSGSEARSLVVTSTQPSTPKSVVAANIALAYAEAGRNVILVEADYRSPHMQSLFEVRNDRGLTTLLSNDAMPLGWATVPTAHPRLGLMPPGPPPDSNAEPLGQRQVNALMRRLLDAADLVIFDSPPIEGHIDAAVLAGQLDGVILVVPEGSEADKTEEAVRTLQTSDAVFLGAVLYRTVRRSRKGARASVQSAPAGWDATRPWLYHAPAQIPAVAQANVAQANAAQANEGARASQGPTMAYGGSTPAQPPPQPPRPHDGRVGPGMMRGTGPYGQPFRPAPAQPAPTQGTPAPTPPAPTPPAPAQAAPAQAAPMKAAPAPSPSAPSHPAPTQSAPTRSAPANDASTRAAPATTVPPRPAPLQAVGPGLPDADVADPAPGAPAAATSTAPTSPATSPGQSASGSPA